MQVIKPVDKCFACQSLFQSLRSLYGMYSVCPSDPGAASLFEEVLKEYAQHHKTVHPVHPDAVVKDAGQ